MSREPLARRAAEAREAIQTFLGASREGAPTDLGVLEHASDLLYSPPAGDHFLEVWPEGWDVEHPEGCAKHGDPDVDCLIGAALGSWLSLETEPPIEAGRYLVQYDEQEGTTRIVAKVEEQECS